MTRYQNILLLGYLGSVLILIKQHGHSMCFSSIFSRKVQIILYLCEKVVRYPPHFGPYIILLNMNLVSKLVSVAAEYIVFTIITIYYTVVLPYFPKTDIENWVNIYHRCGYSFSVIELKVNHLCKQQ